MPRTRFLGKLLGLFLLLSSAGILTHKQDTVAALTALVSDAPLLLVTGMLVLAAGLAMVLGHNVWSGGALPIVVTLLGWVFLIRGTLLLLLPARATTALFEMIQFERFFYLYASINVLLGLYLTLASYGGLGRAQPGTR
jgi:hypothetical protein